jgi:hypothetical protein
MSWFDRLYRFLFPASYKAKVQQAQLEAEWKQFEAALEKESK